LQSNVAAHLDKIHYQLYLATIIKAQSWIRAKQTRARYLEVLLLCNMLGRDYVLDNIEEIYYYVAVFQSGIRISKTPLKSISNQNDSYQKSIYAATRERRAVAIRVNHEKR
jgi:hypothetical protein